jgi:hypothetical protein
MVEFALVFPLFLLIVFAVIVFGLYVFYNQQLANAAREAARYAAVHSSTAQCPTVSNVDPIGSLKPKSYYRCDAPEDGWPLMTEAARSKVWGIAPTEVHVAACWSGFVDASNNHDALPNSSNTFTDCTMRSAAMAPVNPQQAPDQLPCPTVTQDSATDPATADGDDKASSTAVAVGTVGSDTHYPTTVTVYACFDWSPPLAGVGFEVPWGTWSLGIPSTITLRTVVTEALQRQQ